MDVILRVLLDGPVLLLGGVVLILFGGAGLLSTGSAGHSRLRTTRPAVFVAQLAVGVLMASAGATALLVG
jgi:hypothetical protein